MIVGFREKPKSTNKNRDSQNKFLDNSYFRPFSKSCQFFSLFPNKFRKGDF